MRKYEHERLVEIHEEMRSLLHEAKSLIRSEGGIAWERAKGYWVAHIEMALDNDHPYMGQNMFTMQSTINELDPGEDQEDISEDQEDITEDQEDITEDQE